MRHPKQELLLKKKREDPFIRYIYILSFILLCLFSSANARAGLAPKSLGQIPYTWKPVNINGGGFTNFVAIDPINPNIVYAGIDVGGVYRSTDYGEHWQPYNNGLTWPGDRLAAAFAIDSQNGFIYLGTGRKRRGWSIGGVFRKAPEDKDWKLLTRRIKFDSVRQRTGRNLIAIHPSNRQILYSGNNEKGVFKSMDGGVTWRKIGLKDKYLSSILIDYSNPQTVYAASYAYSVQDKKMAAIGGIYKSIDGGDSWREMEVEIQNIYQLVMDPEHPDILYAAAGNQGIFKTEDGGKKWEPKNNGLGFSFRLKRSKILAIAIDPQNPNILYTTSGPRNGQVYKSIDGGESWILLTGERKDIHPMDSWIQQTNQLGGTGYAGTSIAIDPIDTKHLYISGRSGIWGSDDGGITWHMKVKGLEATCMNQIVLDPKRPDTFYAGNSDWVFFWSDDGGKTIKRTLKGMGNWDTEESKEIFKKYRAQDGVGFAIDTHTDPSTVYIALDSGTKDNRGTVFKSTDGGESWSECNKGLPIAGVVSIIIDPTDYNVLYAALRQRGIYKTIDGGKNWKAINNGLPKAENLFKKRRLHPILINPNSPDIVYVLDKGRGVYKTIDGGNNWQIVGDGLPQKGIWGMIHFAGAMVMDPKQPDTLYIGLARHGIYKTLNGGKTWQKISPDFIYHAGAMDIDATDGDLYVSSVPEAGEEDVADIKNPGIYKSPDGGETWFALHNDELLNISLKIISLAVDPHYQGRVYLTTMGNGIIVGEPKN